MKKQWNYPFLGWLSLYRLLTAHYSLFSWLSPFPWGFFCYSFEFSNRVFLCDNSHCSGTSSVVQTILELARIHLPLLPRAGIKDIEHQNPTWWDSYGNLSPVEYWPLYLLKLEWKLKRALIFSLFSLSFFIFYIFLLIFLKVY